MLDRLADGWRAALEPEVAGAAVAGPGHRDRHPAAARRPHARGALRARHRRDLAGQRPAAPGRPACSAPASAARPSRCRRCRRPTGRRSARWASGRRSTAAASVTHFDQLGVFRLLSLIPDSTELRTYVDEVLGPLADAADADSADLRETLRVLLETNLNVAESARRLHFHYNTMRYRIGKLERMLGPFTTDPTLRLNLLLALHAARMRGLDQPHRPPVEAGLTLRAGRRPRLPCSEPCRCTADVAALSRGWRSCCGALEAPATRPASSSAPTCAPPGRSAAALDARGVRGPGVGRPRGTSTSPASTSTRSRPTARTRAAPPALAAGLRCRRRACRRRRTCCSA